MLSGLAAITALALLANVPAHAEQSKHRKGAQTGQPVQQQGSQQLSGNQNNSANIGVYMGAYAYQIARKCLDNILPECPKKN